METLARRADGVMHFVESYRQISRTPEVRRRGFEVPPWAREFEGLFRAGNTADGVGFTLSVIPQTLTMDADPDLMCQVLINLLRNAVGAAVGHSESPAVSLSFAFSRRRACPDRGGGERAGRSRIAPAGRLPPLLHHQGEGTGVGPTLARQVVLAHGGSIVLGNSETGGALFRIVL